MTKGASKEAVAWTVSLGMFMSTLDLTVVNVALTAIARSLKTDLGGVQWVITAYFLSQAAVIPLAGYLGQRFGLKRLFIICQLLFVLGSVLCGLSQDLTVLIIARVIQGLGGGGLFPLAPAIALRAFSSGERASATAILGVGALIAPALGPTLGGLLTDSLGWQAVFLINLPVGLVAAFLAWRVVPADVATPASPVPGRRSFDYIGLGLSIVGVLALVYGLSLVTQIKPNTVTVQQPRGEIYGWSYGAVWVLLVVGMVLLAVFAVYELRFVKDPVLDLRLFKKYSYIIPTLACGVVAMVIFGSIFLLPVFLQSVRTPHLSASEAGLLLFPQGVASAVAVLLSGRFLYNRLGVRFLVTLGAVLLVVGTLGLTSLQPDQDTLGLVPWLILRGLGFGWAFVLTQARALQELSGAALAKGSSLLNVLRQIFSAVGTAIASTYFIQQTTLHATELRATLSQNLPGGASITTDSSQVQILSAKAGTLATNDVFGLVTLGAGLVLLLAVTLPGRSKTQAEKVEVVEKSSLETVALD